VQLEEDHALMEDLDIVAIIEDVIVIEGIEEEEDTMLITTGDVGIIIITGLGEADITESFVHGEEEDIIILEHGGETGEDKDG
jgi:hypothetical protein